MHELERPARRRRPVRRPPRAHWASSTLGEAAVGRTTWGSSEYVQSLRPHLMPDGAATATPAANATAQSGATMSNIRFRIGRVLSVAGAGRRARREGLGLGVEERPPGGLHGRCAPARHGRGAGPHLFSRARDVSPVPASNGRNRLSTSEDPGCQGCGTVGSRGSRRRGHRGGPERARRRKPACRRRMAGARARGPARAGARSQRELTHPGFVHESSARSIRLASPRR